MPLTLALQEGPFFLFSRVYILSLYQSIACLIAASGAKTSRPAVQHFQTQRTGIAADLTLSDFHLYRQIPLFQNLSPF